MIDQPLVLDVDLGERSYPIYIGSDLLDKNTLYQKHIQGDQVCVVSNETVAPIYLQSVLGALSEFNVETVILPDGEEFKTIAVWQRILDGLLQHRFSRNCTIIALGGGVIGDMAGFAAAAYQRGVNFIQVPTTLLSQVDSSVGGKTGVNHPLGKNMVGAFHQPQCVIADISTLESLEPRQLRSGIAEVVKYGLINDLSFFQWLESNMQKLLACERTALIYAVERSCRDKAMVVAADEREAGQRALLNLGHTFGHAIETGMGYGEWLHGEAVAAGTCMAADLSRRLGWLTEMEQERIVQMFTLAELPTVPPENMTADRFLDLMAVDKKVISGKLRLVLFKGIGQTIVTDKFDMDCLRDTLNEYGRA